MNQRLIICEISDQDFNSSSQVVDTTGFQMNKLTPELSFTDYQKSLDFYTRILGFKVKYSRKEEGFAYLYVGSAEVMIDEIGKGRT